MITAEKLKIYKKYSGNIESWDRFGNKKDKKFLETCNDFFKRGTASFEKELWNESYYTWKNSDDFGDSEFIFLFQFNEDSQENFGVSLEITERTSNSSIEILFIKVFSSSRFISSAIHLGYSVKVV